MNYQIRLTHHAASDLAEIHYYVSEADGAEQADALVNKLMKRFTSLETLPARGNRPPECMHDPASSLHEIHEPPFRIIYYILQDLVFIFRVLDARRDLADILTGTNLR